MRILLSFAHGLRATVSEPRLALALWGWSALLTLPVAAPIWRVWRDATADAPRADALIGDLNLATFRELTKFDVTSSWNPAVAALGGVLLLAALGQALVAGGTLEVLLSSERGPFLRRFLAGAGAFFWRFLRVFVLATVAAGVSLGVVALVFEPLARAATDSAWEPGWYLVQAVRVAALALVALFWLIAVDYARIRMAIERDRRSALAALARGVATVARHPLSTFGLWIAGGALVVGLFAVYSSFSAVSAAGTGTLILLMIATQQLAMFVRAGIRVAVVGAEVHLSRRLLAAAAAPPAPEVQPAPEPETPGEPDIPLNQV